MAEPAQIDRIRALCLPAAIIKIMEPSNNLVLFGRQRGLIIIEKISAKWCCQSSLLRLSNYCGLCQRANRPLFLYTRSIMTVKATSKGAGGKSEPPFLSAHLLYYGHLATTNSLFHNPGESGPHR